MARAAGNAVAAGALLLGALAVLAPAPLCAQGKSNQSHGHGNGKAPSSSPLPVVSSAAPPGLGAMPLAWVDDANLMEPGAVSVDLSATRWQGSTFGETDVPVVNMAVGINDRFQFAATVPRVVGNDTTGVVGGLGTTYFSLKYAAYSNDRVGVKLAVEPTLEVLGTGLVQSLAPGETRAQFGLPVSVELDRNGRRFYASTGWFSRGVWFAGAGAGMQVLPRVGLSASLSHSWTTTPDPTTGLTRDRTDLTGGVAYALMPHIALFGTVGHTIATLDENGAGLTIAGGVSLYVSPQAAPRRQ